MCHNTGADAEVTLHNPFSHSFVQWSDWVETAEHTTLTTAHPPFNWPVNTEPSDSKFCNKLAGHTKENSHKGPYNIKKKKKISKLLEVTETQNYVPRFPDAIVIPAVGGCPTSSHIKHDTRLIIRAGIVYTLHQDPTRDELLHNL